MGCPVVLTTTVDSSDDCLVEIARAENIDCYRGHIKNKIRRWADCFAEYGISHALLVDGDDPTFDYNVGVRALRILQEDKTDMVVASSEMTPGFFTYGITHSGINKLLSVAFDPAIDTDVITRFIELANLTKSVVPAMPDETHGHKVRLTIDYPEDIEFYRALYQKVDYLAPGSEVVQIALDNEFQKINWHMHKAFLNNQEAFNEKIDMR